MPRLLATQLPAAAPIPHLGRILDPATTVDLGHSCGAQRERPDEVTQRGRNRGPLGHPERPEPAQSRRSITLRTSHSQHCFGTCDRPTALLQRSQRSWRRRVDTGHSCQAQQSSSLSYVNAGKPTSAAHVKPTPLVKRRERSRSVDPGLTRRRFTSARVSRGAVRRPADGARCGVELRVVVEHLPVPRVDVAKEFADPLGPCAIDQAARQSPTMPRPFQSVRTMTVGWSCRRGAPAERL